jgi:hypothetical protein
MAKRFKFKELHHGIIRSLSSKNVYTIIQPTYKPFVEEGPFNAVSLFGMPALFDAEEEVELLDLEDIQEDDLKCFVTS